MAICLPRAEATYAGANGLVAYTERHELSNGGSFTEIHTMNPDGSDRRRLTFDGGAFIKNVPYPDEPDRTYPVYTVNSSPRWSPDGTKLAYLHRSLADTSEVRVVDPLSGHVDVLFSNWDATTFSWSPDGRQIAYGDESGVWIANADGTGARLITTPSVGQFPNGPTMPSSIASVKWSPDGSRLAFVEWSGGGYVAGALYVSMVDVDGSNRRVDLCEGWGDGRSSAIDWAPDGQTVLCEAPDGDSGIDSVWAVSPDGSDFRMLTHGSSPAWSPDGGQILYRLGDSWADAGELWRYDIASGTAQPLVLDFGGRELDWQAVPLIGQPVGLVDPMSGIWRVADGTRLAKTFYFGNPGDYPIMGDWNCNSVDTPGLYRQSDGYVYLRNSNTQGNADIRFYFGNPGDVPLAGDFNGDGCDTVSIYRQSEGRVYVINALGANDGGLGAAEYAYYFGNPGDKPFIGDFNGDGVGTVGLHRESTGLVYFRNSNAQGIAELEFYFGDPGDRLIAGDWNGDGKDSPAVYRPSDTTFYFRYTNTQGNADEQFLWGWSHWLPVSGQTG